MDEAVQELLAGLSQRPFRKLPGSRRSLFEPLLPRHSTAFQAVFQPAAEAAGRRAIAFRASSCQSIQSILKRNLDSRAGGRTEAAAPPPNIRGSEYFHAEEDPTD